MLEQLEKELRQEFDAILGEIGSEGEFEVWLHYAAEDEASGYFHLARQLIELRAERDND